MGAAFGPRPTDLRVRSVSKSAVRTGIALLRAGRPVQLEGPARTTVLAVETATSELLELLDPGHKAKLLISGHRAAALNLANERDAADPDQPVVICQADW